MHGEKIKEYRLNLEMTQSELGEALEISRNTIARWERNAIVPESWRMVELALKQLLLQKNSNNFRNRIDEAYQDINENIANTKKLLDEIDEMEKRKQPLFTPRTHRKREIQLQS